MEVKQCKAMRAKLSPRVYGEVPTMAYCGYPGAHIGYTVTCNNVTGWLPKAAGICGVVPVMGAWEHGHM